MKIKQGCYKPKETKHRRIAYIASPLRGDIERNLKKATAYCELAVESGAIPIAPHLYFSSFLDDRIPEERAIGMKMGLYMLERCDELWVCGEVISEGMAAEIELAKKLRKPIRFISTEDEDEI